MQLYILYNEHKHRSVRFGTVISLERQDRECVYL